MPSKLYASILSGGIGSRFWPLSRESTPKQLLNVAGVESLLKATIKRLDPLVPVDRISIITNDKQAEIIRLHLDFAKGEPSPGYVLEPMGRNTAPAIGLAAIRLLDEDPQVVMAVLPADHLIKDGAAFRDALSAAYVVAEEGRLVTFGITPTFPETGYGYIKSAREIVKNVDGFDVRKVESFVEKPGIEKAQEYLADGGYYWNSGIFVWKASRILEEMELHAPDIYRALMDIRDGLDLKEAYSKISPISIDHAILEKTDDCVVIEANFPWSDMGSWSSLSDVFTPDSNGNIIKGRVVDIDSSGSIIMGCDRVVASIGLNEMIVIDTPDATLVCPKDRAQDVREIVGIIKDKGFSEHELHPTVEKPWGSYTVLDEGERYKVKKIQVKPGRRLSLQSHEKRSEHWVVVTGRAKVEKGAELVELAANESIYIPKGVKHRIANPGDDILEIIEVQNGEYLGEDDITRYEDDYDRI